MLMNIIEQEEIVKNQVEIELKVLIIGMNLIMAKKLSLEQDLMEVFILLQEILLNGKKQDLLY